MEVRQEDTPVLVAQTGELRGGRWPLTGEEFLIGRSPDCDLVVPDRQVSRYHARLRREGTAFVLEDLGSKNGTHLNGTRIEGPTPVQDGDEIQIALAVKLTFLGTDATIPLSEEDVTVMGLGRLRMDPLAHRVWVGGEEVEPPLSPPQYRLLEILYRNPGRVVPRDEIVAYVWPDSREEGVSEQAIDALVRRLRERLHMVDPGHQYILTVRGHGFRLDNRL